MGLSPFRRVIHLPVNTNIMTRDIFFEVEVLRCGRIPAPGIALCCALGGPVQFADEALDFRAC